MRARVTPDDLAGGSLVQPEWYGCEIVKYEEKPASTDQSTNGFFYFKVIFAPGKLSEFKGARARSMVNEKAWGYSPNPKLLAALGGEVKPGIGIDVDINEKTVVGKKIEVYIGRTTGNDGKEYNTPMDFARPGTNLRDWQV